MFLRCEDDKNYLFHSPRKCQSPSITHQARHCTFVPSLIEISLKILSRVANMAQDIDCLGSGCEWLFMKSIDSAVQLSWTVLHAQNVLLLLLSSENQRGSFSHWKSIQITVEVLVLCCRAGKIKRKIIAFIITGSVPRFPPHKAWGILRKNFAICGFYKLSGIVFTNLLLSHWPHDLPPFYSVKSRLSPEDEMLWISLVVSFR